MNDTLCFTSSYTNCAHNFRIEGIPDARLRNDDTETGFACVIYNILHRAKRSARPSKYLLRELGDPSSDKPFYLVSKSATVPNWELTIKGASIGDNPAHEFFYYYWPKYLPDLEWVRQFILPEADVETILNDYSGRWHNQSVDFYLPSACLVIEIDGSQHSDRLQAEKDRERDKALQASGLTIFRFPVETIRKQDAIFEGLIKRLRVQLSNSKLVEAINCQNNDPENCIVKIQYEQIIRYQVLLLTLIRGNVISVHQDKWSFDIPIEMQQTFSLAAEDLFLWFESLYTLKNDVLKRPIVVFEKAIESFAIENDVFSRRDDSTRATCISLYTDYYDDVDYFHVATNGALIKYEIDWPVCDNQKRALQFVLLNTFGYYDFRQGQLLIITNALCLRDTIGILPTGGGKSLCYFFCTLLQPAPSYAVCPIISLLMDQEKNLREFGITRAVSISGIQTPNERQKAINNFGDGMYLQIWVSPERFQDQKFRNSLQSANMNYMIAYAVIDEAHCVSEWGHDFRTSYLTLINTIRTYTPQVTLLGLTATASQAVLTDLKAEFDVDRTGVKATYSLGRENLSMKVRRTTDGHCKADILKELISNKLFANKDRVGIVFTATKHSMKQDGCIDLLSKISSVRTDLRVDTFHGSLNNDKKISVQNRFMAEDLDVLTATKAFGMGINKTNVRYTIHYGMPMSIEAFYQEAGRAGRDDKPSDCYIIYDPEQPSRELDSLFVREVSDKELHSSLKSMEHDLNTIFFLWLSNNKGVENDVDEIMWFLSEYRSRCRQAKSFDFYCANIRESSPVQQYSVKHRQADVERSLYHLKLLGVVSDWTIAQHEIMGQAILHIYISAFDEVSVHNNFLEYIKKYDPLFMEDLDDVRNRKYFDIINNPLNKGDYLRGHAYALISWIYDHIGYTRRISINNIRELCDKYNSDDDAEQFRKEIENYLRIDEKNGLLDAIAADPRRWHLWFEAFTDNFTNEGRPITKPLTYDGFDSLRMVVVRYIESYADNPGLNLIYLITRAVTGTFDDTVDYEHLDNLIESLSKSDIFRCDMKEIIQQLLITVTGYKNNRSILLFSERICHYMPAYAEMVYNALEDDYSLSIYLRRTTNKINAALRRIQ